MLAVGAVECNVEEAVIAAPLHEWFDDVIDVNNEDLLMDFSDLFKDGKSVVGAIIDANEYISEAKEDVVMDELVNVWCLVGGDGNHVTAVNAVGRASVLAKLRFDVIDLFCQKPDFSA